MQKCEYKILQFFEENNSDYWISRFQTSDWEIYNTSFWIHEPTKEIYNKKLSCCLLTLIEKGYLKCGKYDKM